PWPVAPAAVTTREDLVKAFEYLSLLKFGRDALSWNHLEIAAQFVQRQPESSQAAGRLANLYEHARYAPGDESLPDEVVQMARRELTFLAGEQSASTVRPVAPERS